MDVYSPKEFAEVFVDSPTITDELNEHNIDKLKKCDAMLFDAGVSTCFFVPSGKKSRIPKGYVGCDIATQSLCTLEIELKDGQYRVIEKENTYRIKKT